MNLGCLEIPPSSHQHADIVLFQGIFRRICDVCFGGVSSLSSYWRLNWRCAPWDWQWCLLTCAGNPRFQLAKLEFLQCQRRGLHPTMLAARVASRTMLKFSITRSRVLLIVMITHCIGYVPWHRAVCVCTYSRQSSVYVRILTRRLDRGQPESLSKRKRLQHHHAHPHPTSVPRGVVSVRAAGILANRARTSATHPPISKHMVVLIFWHVWHAPHKTYYKSPL